MKGKVKIVIVNGVVFIGELTQHTNKFTVTNVIQINMNPINQQVSLIPPLFGKPDTVEIYNPRNVIVYDADDKVKEQYKKAILSFKSGIIPVKNVPPQLENTKSNTQLITK